MKFTKEFIAVAERHNTTPEALHRRLSGKDDEDYFANLEKQLTSSPRSAYIEDLFARYFDV